MTRHRGENMSLDRYSACSECRRSPVWTVSPQWALGTHVFTCFPQATAHLLLWKPHRSQACWLQKWCQTYFYTLLPFKFILLSSFSVCHSICNLYSKCLLRQSIPLAQLCVLKFLCERLLLLLLSVNKIFKWPPGSCFSYYIIFYSLGYNSQLAAQLAATKAQLPESTMNKVYWKVMPVPFGHEQTLCNQMKRCIELKSYLCILS